ncbi:hypothetical protein [Aeromicrobium sp. UC242_57]|uniref:hypothetical protein n=1 Tax=Aeromicrobium sp. UC242_57 TaxID=3374624 RepID=UPI00378EE8C9
MIGFRRACATALSALLVIGGLAATNVAAEAAGNPKIRGYVTDTSGKAARTMTVRLFRSNADDSNWQYLRNVNVRSSGAYEVATNGPGRYHLQLVDRRPAYDLNSYARVPQRQRQRRQDSRLQERPGPGRWRHRRHREGARQVPLQRCRERNRQGHQQRGPGVRRHGRPHGAVRARRPDRWDVPRLRLRQEQPARGVQQAVRKVKLRSFRKVSFKRGPSRAPTADS